MKAVDRVIGRLRRARTLTTGLTTALREWDKDGFAPCEPTSWDVPWTLRVARPFDPEWEHVVSEVANHARASLDNLVAHIVVSAGGTYEEHRGKYPIGLTKGAYDAQAGNALRGVPGVAQAVVRAQQPYHDANPQSHPLARLMALSNWDKHQDVAVGGAVLRDSLGVVSSEKRNETAVFELPSKGHGTLSRTPLGDGDDLRAAMLPEALAEFERQLAFVRQDDPEATCSIIARLGVCFGSGQVLVFQLEEIVDFIEHRVVTELAPFVTH